MTTPAATATSSSTAQDPQRPATPEGFVKITEGEATILFPSSDEVFYNPVQVFNRDLSTCVISTFAQTFLKERSERARQKLKRRLEEQASKEGNETPAIDATSPSFLSDHAEQYPMLAAWRGPQDHGFSRKRHGINVLEALAASGLRSVRYYKEIPAVGSILCNDFSEEAVASIQRNVDYNGLSKEDEVIPNHGDACMVMYQHRGKNDRFDVVDIDPYGTAAPFLDSAVQSVSSGGLLCITCTDMAVLCGNHPEACFAKYGTMPAKRQHCHEMGVRTVLALTSRLATRYGRYIKPLLSCSIDFYCRVFVRVFDGAAKGKDAATHMSQMYQCTGCQSFHVVPLGRALKTKKGSTKYTPGHAPDLGRTCGDCGRVFHIGGPIWSGPMHDRAFIGECLEHVAAAEGKYATEDRMKGILSLCREELVSPLYYTMNGMASILHCQAPPHGVIRSALVNAGYEVSPTHCTPQGLKTTAPPSVVWDVYRTWVKENPVSEKVLSSESPAATLLKASPKTEIDLTYRKDAQPTSKLEGLTRYPENPEPNWGPKTRARKRRADAEETPEKRPDVAQ